MEKFLIKLAKELKAKHGNDISNICVVFPSRRAGLHFKKHLGMQYESPIWAPGVYSIEDFIEKLSPLPVSDKLTLIFELYEIYKTHSDETFDKFYPWGEILLRDFDDIDKNMVDADRLFRILYEHKQVEEDFELTLFDNDDFEKFWRSFSTNKITKVQESFIQTWEIMGKVYHAFRSRLLENNICYEGMAYRKVCEMAKTKELAKIIKAEHGWKHITFAGFNMLSAAEQGIIQALMKQGIADTYWDTDAYYFDNKIQEAGNFLRKSMRELGVKDEWKGNDLLDSKKKLKIIGTPLKVSQSKVLGNELMEVTEFSETAVILPDDGLMLPVIHSIPENIKKLNITMGFPFKNSPLYSLLYILKNIHAPNKSRSAGSYYHKDVTQSLLHPYIKFAAPNEIYDLVNNIKKRNIVFTSRKRILEAFTPVPEIVSAIFTTVETARESLDNIYKIVELIAENLTAVGLYNSFDSEYIFKFYTELNKLDSIMSKYSTEMDKDTFWKLLVEIARTIKIPFTGEPLEGVQVMGLLESRALDFKNVYILSMNEDTIPQNTRHTSFIPYNLRKGLKMPVFDDRDAETAYYFYRLLQKAENITLIYNTEPGEIMSGEKSRFLMQVENELVQANKNISFEQKIMQTDAEPAKRREITIPKSEAILTVLNEREHLASTTLSTYINCPLQFYFKTVTRLRELREVEEFFSGAGFGSILHQIMDDLYTPFTGKEINEKIIEELSIFVDNNYEKIWETACAQIPEYEEFKSELRGKNLLYKNIIKKLVGKILENDLTFAPFSIVALEKKIEQQITLNIDGKEHTIKLLGVLDRVQKKDGVENIIDYKTGVVNSEIFRLRVDAENVNVLFENPKYKEKFQQYFYSIVYLNGESKKIKAGIYPLKDLSKGLRFFDETYMPPQTIEAYQSKLNEMLIKIFDSTTPFTQTPDIDNCKWCDYKSICYRD